MTRARDVMDVWNWLPAFRAIAEHSSIHGAAAQLHVSPSALSRSLKLLEAQVGHALFNRVGRVIQINARGEQLLAGVRSGMRIVDDGLANARQNRLEAEFRIAGPEDVFALWALDAARAAHRREAGLGCAFIANREAPVASLLRGDLDLIITNDPPTDAGPSVSIVHLGGIEIGLFGAKRKLPAGTPVASCANSLTVPGLVPKASRNVLRVPSLPALVHALARGDLLGELPLALAREASLHLQSRTEPIALYALRRSQLQPHGAVDILLEELLRSAQAKRAITSRRRS